MAGRIVKALSVQQPYASQIATGEKWVEWRGRRTSHRGALLICASKAPKVGDLPLGVALAIVEVVDCLPADDQWGWCLDNLRRVVRPFEVTGRLGLYKVTLPRGCKLARARRRPADWWERATEDDDEDPDAPIKTWVF